MGELWGPRPPGIAEGAPKKEGERREKRKKGKKGEKKKGKNGTKREKIG